MLARCPQCTKPIRLLEKDAKACLDLKQTIHAITLCCNTMVNIQPMTTLHVTRYKPINPNQSGSIKEELGICGY
jgi:hypothetical protein